MKSNLFKEVMGETMDIISRAKFFFAIALVTSIAIDIKAGTLMAWWSMFVLCYFSSTIGLQKYMIEVHKRISDASMEINEINYNKLIADTDNLSAMKKQLEANEANLVKYKLELLISENIQTINAIKSAKNGARQ